MIIRSFLFAVLVFLVEFYFTRKIVKAVKSIFGGFKPGRLKSVLIPLLLILNIYPVFLISVWIYAALSGTPVLVPQNSYFDYFVLYPFWSFIFIAVQCGLYFLLFDLIRIAIYPIYKKHKAKLRSYELKFIFLLTVFFTVYVPARVIYDYYNVSVRVVEYKKKDLPAALNNFKIVLVADIQADRYTDKERLTRFISKINSSHPDLVLIAGDVITSTPNYINEAAEFIGQIKSKYGVYACVGDHDNWAYRRDYKRSLNEITSALLKHNVEMVNNGKRIVKVDSTDIGISFVTNTYVEHISRTELDSLTNGKTKYGLKILLTHQPRQKIVDAAVKNNYDLMLAGHTHGGQVTFLFPFINLTPTLLETKYVRGDFHFGSTMLVVTRGLGMSLVPMRYNSSPEVTVIVVSKKN